LKAVDTTFIIDLLRGDMDAVEKAEEFDVAGEAAIPAVNLFEITYGVYKSRHIDRERRLFEVERLFSRMDLFPLDARAAVEAGKILESSAERER